MDQHLAGTVISDSASGVRTSTAGDLCAECAVGMTVSFCGLPGGNGLRVVPGRWREQHGWGTQLTNGDRSVSARGLAEGKGMLGDTRVLIVDDSALYRDYLAGVVVAHGMVNPGVAWDLPSLTTEIENHEPAGNPSQHGNPRQYDVATAGVEAEPKRASDRLGAIRGRRARDRRVRRGRGGRISSANRVAWRTTCIDTEGCCRGVIVFATSVGNSASPVIGSRFTTTTFGQGTSSNGP